MRVFFSLKQYRHAPAAEIFGGQMVRPFESPERAVQVFEHFSRLGQVQSPRDYGLEPVRRAHDPAYVDFLSSCWQDWQAAGFEGEAFATVMPSHKTGRRLPAHIEGRIGYFAFSGNPRS